MEVERILVFVSCYFCERLWFDIAKVQDDTCGVAVLIVLDEDVMIENTTLMSEELAPFIYYSNCLLRHCMIKHEAMIFGLRLGVSAIIFRWLRSQLERGPYVTLERSPDCTAPV